MSHTTRPRTVRSALQRLRTMPATKTFAAGNSYLGLMRQASHGHADQAQVANALRRRGHAVAGDLGKVFRAAQHRTTQAGPIRTTPFHLE